MFSQNDLVNYKAVIESTYRDTCNVIEHSKGRTPDGSMGFTDITTYENVPCRLSFTNIQTASETDSATAQAQVIKVFLSPDIMIKTGSKLEINHLGRLMEFKNTSLPSIYETHQEIELEVFKGWT